MFYDSIPSVVQLLMKNLGAEIDSTISPYIEPSLIKFLTEIQLILKQFPPEWRRDIEAINSSQYEDLKRN